MDSEDGELGSGLDPKLMLAATTLLIAAASVGTWKVFQPVFAAAHQHRVSDPSTSKENCFCQVFLQELTGIIAINL